MENLALAEHDLRALNAALKGADHFFETAMEQELSAPAQRLVWASVHRIISSPDSGQTFNAQQFEHFDGRLQSSLFHAVPWESRKSDALRENFAALRYFIFDQAGISIAFESGIAQHLSRAIRKANHWWNPFAFKLLYDQATPLGIGAQRMYLSLLNRQHPYVKMGRMAPLLQQISGHHPMPWRLPPLPSTPFSDWALRQPLPPADEEMPEDLVDHFAEMMDRYSITAPEQTMQQLDALAEQIDAIEQTAQSFQSIDSLQEPTRRESVEIAKEILRKLKLALGQAQVGEGLNMDSTTDPFALLDALKGAVRVYEYHLHKVMQLDATIMENPAVAAANQAIGKFGFIAKSMVLHTAKRLNDTRMVKVVKDQLMKMPKSWAPKPTERYSTLLNDLEGGLNTVLSRYLQLANKQGSTQFWLGFSNENALGKQDPAKQQAKAMAEDAYYQQLNELRMQRQQQQQQMAAALAGQFKPNTPDTPSQKGANASANQNINQPQTQQPSRPSIPPIMTSQQQNQADQNKPKQNNAVIGQNQLANMRKSMATDANAEMVIVNQRQAQLRQMREQRQRQQQEQQRAARREQRQAQKQAQSQAKDTANQQPQVKAPEMGAPQAEAPAAVPSAASSISNASKNTKPQTDKKPKDTEKKKTPKAEAPVPPPKESAPPPKETEKKIAPPPPPKKTDRSHGF